MAVIDNLIASWELDEASGNAIDSHGANDLTDNGTVGTNGSGWRDFEADIVEYFSLADNSDLSTGGIDFEIEASVQLESTTVNRHIVRRWDGGGTEYILLYGNNTGFGTNDRFQFLIRNSLGDVTVVSANNLGAPSVGTPYHILAWVKTSPKEIGIKVNNGTADTASYSGNISDTGATFYLGHADGESADWDGLMRHVRFWKKKLTTDEETWLYNSGSGRSYSDIVNEAGGGAVSTTDGRVVIAPVNFS